MEAVICKGKALIEADVPRLERHFIGARIAVAEPHCFSQLQQSRILAHLLPASSND
ncbi:hypothetical protein [Bosea sp. Tri-44]|uniref:hypothetical protein n=1 Tax=Bosea sp. Tri-44 TaxID=1972137 RepID=UPI0013E992BD|nr:hypothetical protein [Bosea sp. Tri-44]